MTPERQRRTRLQQRMNWIAFGANGAGIFLVTAYFTLLAEPVADAGASPGMRMPGYLLSGGLLVLGGLLASRWTRPLDHWYQRQTADDPHPPAPPLVVQRQALNYPLISALISLSMWLLAGLLSGLVFAPQVNWRNLLQSLLLLGGVSGTLVSVLIYFLVERAWRSEIRLFFPDQSPTSIQAFRVTVRTRLLILFILQTVPLLLLALSSYAHASQIAVSPNPLELLPRLARLETFVLVVGGLMAVLLAVTLGASLIDPIESLRRAMGATEQGNLDAQAPVTSNDELGALAAGFNAMLTGLRREEVIRTLFGRYVTREVAEHAIAHGAELGGQLTEVSVLFSDIRGFTTLTEQMEPNALIALLNRYFEAMSAVVATRGGLVNKFGGDSLLAVFGSPVNPAPDHAERATHAALDMLAALEQFNAGQRAQGLPPLRIGVGIATGPVVAGNVGSRSRLEYTVIGDTVNLASRLQTLTKELHAPILLNQAAAAAVQTWAPLEPVGTLEVRGKLEAVQVFALRAEPPHP